MQFVFVTAISISTSETQGKLTQYQHHRKKNNRKILHPVDQPLADLDLEKQHGKVIQRRAGGNNKLLEKGMETPSSLVIDLLTTISNCYYWRKNTQRRLSVKSLTTKIISSFPCMSQPRSLHLVHLHKPELFSLATRLVGFKWNLLHNLFQFDNSMQYIHICTFCIICCMLELVFGL